MKQIRVYKRKQACMDVAAMVKSYDDDDVVDVGNEIVCEGRRQRFGRPLFTLATATRVRVLQVQEFVPQNPSSKNAGSSTSAAGQWNDEMGFLPTSSETGSTTSPTRTARLILKQFIHFSELHHCKMKPLSQCYTT